MGSSTIQNVFIETLLLLGPLVVELRFMGSRWISLPLSSLTKTILRSHTIIMESYS